MTKRSAHSGQHTFLVSELQPGWIYLDALSGALVLVREVVVVEYDAGGNKHPVKRMVGWYWNAVHGRHMELQLHDNQLMSVGARLV